MEAVTRPSVPDVMRTRAVSEDGSGRALGARGTAAAVRNFDSVLQRQRTNRGHHPAAPSLSPPILPLKISEPTTSLHAPDLVGVLRSIEAQWHTVEAKGERLSMKVPAGFRPLLEFQQATQRLTLSTQLLSQCAEGVSSFFRRMQQLGAS